MPERPNNVSINYFYGNLKNFPNIIPILRVFYGGTVDHNDDTQALKAVVPGFEKAKLRNFGMTIGINVANYIETN